MRTRRQTILCFVVTLASFSLCLHVLLLQTHLAAPHPKQGPHKVDAQRLFQEHCAKCHGKDGRAKTFRGKLVGARNLTDVKWQAGVTDEGIKEAIEKGPEEMPAFAGKLQAAEIEGLVKYVRGLRAGQEGVKKE